MLSTDELALLGFVATVSILAFNFYSQHFELIVRYDLSLLAWFGVAASFSSVLFVGTAAVLGEVSLTALTASGHPLSDVALLFGHIAHVCGLAAMAYLFGALTARMRSTRAAAKAAVSE